MVFSKIFKKTKPTEEKRKKATSDTKGRGQAQQRKAVRKGELGEYKINIQLDQLPGDCRYLSDLLIPNPKTNSGYSQIDHVIMTPFGLFVIETKNYQGQIIGKRNEKIWFQNGKFKVQNPFHQNYGHIKALQNLLKAINDIHFISMISFTRRAIFKVDPELRKIQSDELIVYDTELSEFIHRKLRILPKLGVEPCLTAEAVSHIYDTLSQANITDANVRKEHITKSKVSKDRSNSESKSKSNATCAVCGKSVPDKVKKFCMSNRNRFGGKIYCFEHQKVLK